MTSFIHYTILLEHLNDGSTIEQACLQLIFGSSAQVTLSPCDGEVGHNAASEIFKSIL